MNQGEEYIKTLEEEAEQNRTVYILDRDSDEAKELLN